jgi:hypothetical protein
MADVFKSMSPEEYMAERVDQYQHGTIANRLGPNHGT